MTQGYMERRKGGHVEGEIASRATAGRAREGKGRYEDRKATKPTIWYDSSLSSLLSTREQKGSMTFVGFDGVLGSATNRVIRSQECSAYSGIERRTKCPGWSWILGETCIVIFAKSSVFGQRRHRSHSGRILAKRIVDAQD